MLQKFLKNYGRDILLLVAVLLAVEWWQTRNLVKESLPPALLAQELPLLGGGTTKLSSSTQHTVLYIFAPWCGVCRISASNLNHLPSASLRVLNLAQSWEIPAAVQEFLDHSGLKGQVIMGDEGLGEALRVQAYPTYYLIDREGRIIRSWSGYTTIVGLWLRSRSWSL